MLEICAVGSLACLRRGLTASNLVLQVSAMAAKPTTLEAYIAFFTLLDLEPGAGTEMHSPYAPICQLIALVNRYPTPTRR